MFPYPTDGDRKNERIEDYLNKECNVCAILFQAVYPYRILLLTSLNLSGTIFVKLQYSGNVLGYYLPLET